MQWRGQHCSTHCNPGSETAVEQLSQHVGRARATPELHGAVQRGTVGRGLNRDHRPCTGRGSYASTHAHLGTAGRETILGIVGRERAGGAARLGAGATRRRMHISAPPAARPFWDRGLRAGRRSCATRSGPTRLRMPISAPPAAGPARGPWAASGPEELRDSEWSRGCRRDAVTVCFQYPAPEVTVMVT